jgi:hypothetical protein
MRRGQIGVGLLLLVLLLLLGSGCGGATVYEWAHPSKSAQQRELDTLSCELFALELHPERPAPQRFSPRDPMSDLGDGTRQLRHRMDQDYKRNHSYSGCMTAEGYERIPIDRPEG